MPPPIDPKVRKEEQEALKKVTLKSFGVNPKSVRTLGSTVVSWDVTVPATSVDIAIELNDRAVAPKGSQSFSLVQSTTFTLVARTENAGRQLRRLTVTVDPSDCRSKLIEALLITLQIKNAVKNQFGASKKFKLRDNGPTVTMTDGEIGIGVRLTLNVPNWFDADMNITIQLSVLPGPKIKVASKNVFVNVKWGFFEHLTSLGCTGFVQSGMEQIAREFLTHIVDAELAPAIADGLNAELGKFVASLHDGDPQHREYVLTLLTVKPNGVTFTACPR